MLKECIEKILGLAQVQTLTVNRLDYTDKPIHLVMPPQHSHLEVVTLTGLADLVRERIDDLDPAKWLVQVDRHTHVSVVERTTDEWGRRACLISAVLKDGESFRFGQWLPREEFVIGLQSQFAQQGDVLEVLRLASALEVSAVVLSEDDGISQKTTTKQGVTLKETVTVKGRVKLAPYRTFREVAQPVSEFVFRLRSRDGMVPECALFESDGGKWKLDAVLTIKGWLEQQGLGLPVVA